MATTAHGPTVDLALATVTSPPPLSDWLVVVPVVLCLSSAAIALMLRRRVALQPVIAIVALSLLLATDIALLLKVFVDGPIVMVMGKWLAPFGIAFEVDAMGITFATTAAFVALAGAITMRAEFNPLERRYGAYPFLLLLMAGVSGAFLTGDIFNLYVWFEVLLISSFGLIVMGSEKPQIDGAVKYALLNLMATTLFLVATGLLYGTLGTLNMADIARITPTLPSTSPLVPIAALYFFAFGMKAAAFPVNFWLPASYHTPRVVVSALFSGLLTKVGVYALLRTLILMLPVQAAMYTDVAAWVAGLTILVGAFGALAHSDLRRQLGYIIVSGIGAMLVAIAIPNTDAVAGAIFYAVHSMIVMTALYLAAGIMARRTGGSFDLRKLGGLYGADPLLAGIFLVLALAVAGLPPFSGFWPKLMLVDAAISAGHGWLAAAILFGGFLTTLAVGRVWIFAFLRGGPEGTADGTTAFAPVALGTPSTRITLMVPLVVLTLAAILIGVFPAPLHVLSSVAAFGLIDPSTYIGAVYGAAGG
ncbi:Na(+)/H(+) antiporter subunit D [Hartmannibacter diazotrophicus]|uniref:Na(+)/H(+) antiporter subunit D n=1 Tax=Hartmannibacter diazotrophicus TaxID=1482074 RepID=A0A2C9D3L3_9HYPH|nr:Na+/H+ antiporter subunit D [Hartmannibacter diazotrophicus]SON54856.1 Na(+)/H(+) antiporter subunit D [Hartmannibacter diazotrophicus]